MTLTCVSTDLYIDLYDYVSELNHSGTESRGEEFERLHYNNTTVLCHPLQHAAAHVNTDLPDAGDYSVISCLCHYDQIAFMYISTLFTHPELAAI